MSNVTSLPKREVTSDTLLSSMAAQCLGNTFPHYNQSLATVCDAGYLILVHDQLLHTGTKKSNKEMLVSVAYINTYKASSLVPGEIIRVDFDGYIYDLYIKPIHSNLFDDLVKLLQQETLINEMLELSFKKGEISSVAKLESSSVETLNIKPRE